MTEAESYDLYQGALDRVSGAIADMNKANEVLDLDDPRVAEDLNGIIQENFPNLEVVEA